MLPLIPDEVVSSPIPQEKTPLQADPTSPIANIPGNNYGIGTPPPPKAEPKIPVRIVN